MWGVNRWKRMFRLAVQVLFLETCQGVPIPISLFGPFGEQVDGSVLLFGDFIGRHGWNCGMARGPDRLNPHSHM